DCIVYDGTPYDSLKGVRIEPSRFEIEPEGTFALVALPLPSSADFDAVEWSTDNPEVASVEGNGIVHAGNLGETTITVKITDRFGVSKSASIVVTCTDNPDNSDITNVNSIATADWYAYSSGKRITIENAKYGGLYTIYNLQGIIIGETTADNNQITFTVSQPGVYMIKSGLKVIKVICN
ncbi:MAG: Ig-like domain-containing protein, partial [Muribaculaceae bacterium]|nr:Ig-like domain-containing protein [Muribaculaceae bacterium]